MIAEVVEAASTRDLTTVARVKKLLGLSGNDHDAILGRLVRSASDRVRTLTGRVFALERVIEALPGHGTTQLMVDRTPIREVHSVAHDGEPVVDFEIRSPGAGILYRRSGWLWSPTLRAGAAPHPQPGSEAALFRVDHTAGYVLPGMDGFEDGTDDAHDLPADVEDFVTLLVHARFEALGRDPLITQESIGDWSVNYGGATVSKILTAEADFVARWGRVM